MNSIVCYCKAVDEEEILDAIHNKNAKTEEDIQRTTEASTGCGRCRRNVKYIIERELQKK